MGANSSEALGRRRDSATLTWRGPALMLFARSGFAVVAQALVAAILALRGARTPWADAGPWLPVYGTLIDAGCLALLWTVRSCLSWSAVSGPGNCMSSVPVKPTIALSGVRSSWLMLVRKRSLT